MHDDKNSLYDRNDIWCIGSKLRISIYQKQSQMLHPNGDIVKNVSMNWNKR